MQKLGLSQSLQQKLSPQQIQFIKLLQVPTAELEARIEEELEINPALEEGEEQEKPEENYEDQAQEAESEYQESSGSEGEVDIKDYLQDDDYSGYKMQGDGDDDEDREMPIPMASSLHEQLMTQLDFLGLDERQYSIGKQLVGSIESDGYIRRELEAIVNDLAFSQGIETNVEEVRSILKMIQTFDPPGIAARDLQECLLLQLERLGDVADLDDGVSHDGPYA